jgi:hypothetical protein
VLIALPANAQKIPPLNLMMGGAGEDAYTKQHRKDIEDEYNAAMKKIPDKKLQNSDPWNKLRSSNEGKGQSTK